MQKNKSCPSIAGFSSHSVEKLSLINCDEKTPRKLGSWLLSKCIHCDDKFWCNFYFPKPHFILASIGKRAIRAEMRRAEHLWEKRLFKLKQRQEKEKENETINNANPSITPNGL
jgi:hypothetical protein